MIKIRSSIIVNHQGDVCDSRGNRGANSHPERLPIGEPIIETMLQTKDRHNRNIKNV